MKSVLWLPSQALFESDGRKFVYVRRGSGFTPQDVNLVRRSETSVVIEGLKEGELVALASPDQIRSKNDGAKGGAHSGDSTMILADLGQAAANLRAQKTRTMLTALGIVFGVGSVIGMLAIGAGAREESLSFIEQFGVRNVLIDSRPATNDRSCNSAGALLRD